MTTATLLSAATLFALACVVLAMLLYAAPDDRPLGTGTACWRSTRCGCA